MQHSKWANKDVGDDWYAPPTPQQEPWSSDPGSSSPNIGQDHAVASGRNTPQITSTTPPTKLPVKTLRYGLEDLAVETPSWPTPPVIEASMANPSATAAASTAAPMSVPPTRLTGHVLVNPISKAQFGSSLPTAEKPMDRAVLISLESLSDQNDVFQAFWDRVRAELPPLGHGLYLRLVVPSAGLRVDINGKNAAEALGMCKNMIGSGAYVEYVFEDRSGSGRKGMRQLHDANET